MRRNREFALVLILAMALRAMAVLVFRPGGYLGEMSDFGYYRLLLSMTNQGYYPLVHFWTEYPPVFPWLMLGLYRLSLLIPPWVEPGTWFYLLLSTALVVVEAGNLIVLYAIGRRLYGNDERAVRVCWIYAALLIPLVVLFGGFDGLALLFLLLAVLFTLDRRPIAAGAAAGIGFMTKLVPIAALPAAFLHLSRLSQRAKLLIATTLVVLLIAAPFLATGPDYLLQSLKSPVIRSTWETVWALIDGYYSYGVAGGVDRFDPQMAGGAQHPTRLPWLVITTAFCLFYLYLFTRRVDWSDKRRVVAFTALTQNLLTLYFKGYSPQFLVMLLPFVLLLITGWRKIAYVLLLSAVNLVEYPVYFVLLPDQHWLLAGTVLIRTVILLILSVEYAAQVYGWQVSERAWTRLAAGVTVVVIVLGLVGAVAGLQAYAKGRYKASPHRLAIDTLKAQAESGATVVVDDQTTYEQLYPFLRTRVNLEEVETFDYLPPWETRLADVIAGSSGPVWVYAPAESPIQAWMATRYGPLVTFEFDSRRLIQWDTP
jgi:Glycosyltransferase family 87